MAGLFRRCRYLSYRSCTGYRLDQKRAGKRHNSHYRASSQWIVDEGVRENESDDYGCGASQRPIDLSCTHGRRRSPNRNGPPNEPTHENNYESEPEHAGLKKQLGNIIVGVVGVGVDKRVLWLFK
jgi:hypothetical protein